jgi:hypothetical protein
MLFVPYNEGFHMGFELHGCNPSLEIGRRLSMSEGGWHAVAEYITEMWPEHKGDVPDWHHTGGVVSETAADDIADRLDDEINSGRAETYVLEYNLAVDEFEAHDPLAILQYNRIHITDLTGFVTFCRYSGGFEIR